MTVEGLLTGDVIRALALPLGVLQHLQVRPHVLESRFRILDPEDDLVRIEQGAAVGTVAAENFVQADA